MSAEDPFAVLGLAPTASADEIRAAYRGLLKKHKPELDPDGFRRIREAFERANAVVAMRAWHPRPPDASTSEAPAGIPESVSSDPAVDERSLDGRRSHPSSDVSARFEELAEFDRRFWEIPESEPERRAVFVLAELRGEPDDEDLAPLLFEAFAGIRSYEHRRTLLLPFVDDERPVMRALLVAHAPTLLTDERLAQWQDELDDPGRFAIGIEWARRGRTSDAMAIAESFAELSGDRIHPDMVLHSLAMLGLELLASGDHDEAVRIRELARTIDATRPLGRRPGNSLELLRFRRLLERFTTLGAASVAYLAVAALGSDDVRAAATPSTLGLTSRTLTEDDPILGPLVPERVVERLPLPHDQHNPEVSRGLILLFALAFLALSRVVLVNGCGNGAPSRVAAAEARGSMVRVPVSGDDFGRAIEHAAESRACVEGFEDSWSSPDGYRLRVPWARCTLASSAAEAIGSGDCDAARQALDRDRREFSRGETDDWSIALASYVGAHCPDGARAP